MSYKSELQISGDGDSNNSSLEVSEDIYESYIEEVVIETSSDEEKPAINTQVRTNIKTRKKNKELELGYDLLDAEIDASEVSILTLTNSKWKRKDTILNALSLLEQLTSEEKHLRDESERLFQENWKLRKRVEVFEKMKRRKKRRTSHVITRSVSGCLGGEAKNTPEKVNKVDNSRINKTPQKNSETDNKKNISENTPKHTKRRSKKNTIGLTDEEKKFVELDDKIEDILHEVDLLWSEVKDEPEENDEEKPDTKLEVKPIKPEMKKETEVEKNREQTLVSIPTEKPPLKKILPKLVPVSKLISVKNLSSLLKPEYNTQKLNKAQNKEQEQTAQLSENQECKSKDDDEREIIADKDNETKLKSQEEVIVISEGSDSENETTH